MHRRPVSLPPAHTPPPLVDKLAAKLREGPNASRPLVLLARSRAATYRGEMVTVPTGEFSPSRLAACTEACELAFSAANADPSSPLLATHAVFACYLATNSGAAHGYGQAVTLHGECSMATLVALLPLCYLRNRTVALLVNVLRVTEKTGAHASDPINEARRAGT